MNNEWLNNSNLSSRKLKAKVLKYKKIIGWANQKIQEYKTEV
jgi:hypothetical protein